MFFVLTKARKKFKAALGASVNDEEGKWLHYCARW